MHTIDKKSYIIIEVSKDKNKLVPMLALGMGMSNTQAVVIFSLPQGKHQDIQENLHTLGKEKQKEYRGIISC